MKVFLFPGQGSQEVGMGSDLFRSDSAFRELIAVANELVGEDLEPICRRGPEKRLSRSRFLQPLLVAVSLGYFRRLNERGVQPDVVLGHSLGEITALAAAGMVAPEDAIRIAAKRGELMEEAADGLHGSMLAVTLEERSRLLAWLACAQAGSKVVLANDNAPTQIVLSGESAALGAAANFISSEKLGRCRPLTVAGPWHSPLMAETAARFDAWLRQLPLHPPRLRMLFNATAAQAEDPEEICALVSGQLAKPVRWAECMGVLRTMNPRRLFEVGPGRVLSALARANGFGETIQVLRVNDLRGVELAAQTVANCHAGRHADGGPTNG
jgi:[acyl-carrier-protein] S-malonyltransferase